MHPSDSTRRKGVFAMLTGGLLVLLAACTQAEIPPGRVDAARLTAADTEPGQWMSHGRTYDEQRFSPLAAITAQNVAGLGLAWSFDLQSDRGVSATPIVVDGTMYVTAPWSIVHALDARTGEPKWSFDPQVDRAKGFDACCDVVNRGVAVWEGKVFVGALDGRLIALDAGTGARVWEVQTTDTARPYTITGAPRVVKGKVLIGNGGGEYGVRGYISAYDAASGAMAWRFYTVPNPDLAPDGQPSDRPLLERANATWSGDHWKTSGGGGTVWDAMAYDPGLDLLYVGVGNGSPWNHRVRSEGRGDNLFLSSIVALRPDTGEYVWHYQTTPGDTWDYTATQHIMLADLEIAGQRRAVLMQVPKNGFFYVIDRATGQLISARNIVPLTWARGVDMATGRPIENPAARFAEGPALVAPAPFGAHNWHPMAFSPQSGLVYIPAMDIPAMFANAPGDTAHRPRGWNTGVDMLLGALPNDRAQLTAIRAMVKGHLAAWDPVTQQEVWRVQHDGAWNGGVLATAGNLVFQGTADGRLVAYAADRASNGRKLW
jgi:PQQ-dependent dehydrogenase (methanol/ethanol family)